MYDPIQPTTSRGCGSDFFERFGPQGFNGEVGKGLLRLCTCGNKFFSYMLIKDEWIEQVIHNPLRAEVQSDGRIRKWARIAAMGNRALRVILLEDGETVHNAFFDRSFKE